MHPCVPCGLCFLPTLNQNLPNVVSAINFDFGSSKWAVVARLWQLAYSAAASFRIGRIDVTISVGAFLQGEKVLVTWLSRSHRPCQAAERLALASDSRRRRFWVVQRRGSQRARFWRDGVERFAAAMTALFECGFSRRGRTLCSGNAFRTNAVVRVNCYPANPTVRDFKGTGVT